MRFAAPARAAVDPAVFARPPLAHCAQFADLLLGPWPDIAALNARVRDSHVPRFVAQTRELLGDGLHYEQRIFARGEIATRAGNWHDLLNALIWLRFPQLKLALNARQVAEIARMGAKQRSRAQCALTHFDEAGVIVLLRDRALLRLWDAHDWHALFWRQRTAWTDGRIEVVVFGHALLEHALRPEQLLVGKCVAMLVQSENVEKPVAHLAAAIRAGDLLDDPQELRPLPLCGIPGWHCANEIEDFYRVAPCFRPRRVDRKYPPARFGASFVD